MPPVRLLPLGVLLFLVPAGQVGGQTTSSATETHPAPSARGTDPGAPSEGELSPPPDAEKAPETPGFVQVENPAFPGAALAVTPAPRVDRGRKLDERDVAPYFAEGVLAQAKAEFDKGHHARARALLAKAPAPDALPVRYLAALAASRAGDAKTAAAEFAALLGDETGAGGYTPLRDRLLVQAALANEDLERWDEAAKLYAQVPGTSKLYVDARFGLYRAARKQRALDQAEEALRPLAERSAPMWGRDVAAEALLSMADLARDRKDPEAERAALLALWSRHPLTGTAAHAFKRLKGKVPVEAIVTRAENLIEAHRNEAGMDALRPHLEKLVLPDPLACRAHMAFGKALRKQREHTKAIQALTPVVEQCTDPDLRVRALYVLGSSRSIVDQAHGPETYETLAREFPAHSFADDALFFAADLYLRNGDSESALKRLDEIASKYKDGDFLGEALFKRFWIQRELQRTDDAVRTLDEIEQTFATARESYEVERARYWRARMLLDGGKRDEAARLFERIAVMYPVTYYGLMSRTRLEELAPERAEAVRREVVAPTEAIGPWPLHAGAVSDDPHLLAGIELLRLGFGEAASSELLAINRARLASEPLRLIVHTLALAGDAKSAHAIARTELRDHLSGPIRADTRPIWQVAYPDAFRPLIEKHCASANLDPDLLQALMREESALDPKALSWAGALGLTQLMLSTAKSVARGVPEIGRVTPQLLLQPDPNIRLGAAHLGSLVKRFDGNKAYAIASYNAGAGAVNRWRDRSTDRALDEWVEEIPIAETRGYVKRVLRSYNTYQLLYGRGIATVLPEKEGASAAPGRMAPQP